MTKDFVEELIEYLKEHDKKTERLPQLRKEFEVIVKQYWGEKDQEYMISHLGTNGLDFAEYCFIAGVFLDG